MHACITLLGIQTSPIFPELFTNLAKHNKKRQKHIKPVKSHENIHNMIHIKAMNLSINSPYFIPIALRTAKPP